MLFMVSHEVRHPVSQILGIIQILQDYSTVNEECAELISSLKVSAEDLDIFIKRLSSFMHELRPESEISSDESK